MKIPQLLENTAKKFPTKPAIIFQGKPISFHQCKDIVFKLANGLKDLGIKKPDKIALYMPNCPEYVYT